MRCSWTGNALVPVVETLQRDGSRSDMVLMRPWWSKRFLVSCFTIVCADAPQALTPRYFSQVRQARFACARRMNRDGISCSEHANSTCPTVALLNSDNRTNLHMKRVSLFMSAYSKGGMPSSKVALLPHGRMHILLVSAASSLTSCIAP